ncbi:AAA domain-containing protein [Phreatobacter sp.]|uniref:AAA domain-containing protein n=1 Tax=Phreatobacter sp. TaxID=1966341 RepID=UPI003F6EE699
MRYYAATQRRDPRGAVEAFPDGHGLKWHLFDCRGRWWDGAEIAVSSALLEGGFLQAVAESGSEGSAAVGWPIGVFRGSAGVECIPALLFPVSWRLGDERLVIVVDVVQPALNPAFVRQVKRLTRLSEDALLRVLEPGEGEVSFEVICKRFGHLLAKIGGQGLRAGDLLTEISLTGEGLRNAAAIFLADESSFTRRVAEDLDTIAEWPEERRRGTALHALLSHSEDHLYNTNSTLNVVEIEPLTERQFLAADAALSGAVTAIQGPPGTGKSQTIVALLASALAEGVSVIFVARNHRALDEVEKRLLELLPGSVAMVRARDADGERDTSMYDVLVELANGGAVDGEAVEAVGDRRKLLLDAARTRVMAFRAEAELTRYHLTLADLVERLEDLEKTYAATGASSSRRGWHRLIEWLRGWFWSEPEDLHSAIPGNSRPEEIRRRIAALRSKLSMLPAPSEPPLPPVHKHLLPLVQTREVPDAETLRHLRSRKSDLEFMRSGARIRHLTADDASILLRYRPVWAASTLSVPARIPLAPALFDLAIFDEASQCDVASALPILARAKRAVIVGDPEQLSFIPSLGRAQEHALMDAAGLPKAGRGAWAQSRNSLFDFARARMGVDRLHLLPDQFRSAPAIVDYTSETFYGGRLRARKDDDDFHAPRSYRPGLHWEDVRGACAREDGGNINRAEAEWIAQRIMSLAGEDGFEGSVGVISPFTAQVALIRRLVEQAVAPEARAQFRLGIDTVDAWQGGEADVVFISLAVGANAAHSAISFLSKERRRFNVAVSRAKAVATIVGDLAWARNCGITHVEILAERATRPATTSRLGFDSRWERRVHEALVSRGLDPKPQYPLGRRSLDFALFNEPVRLDLEIDGRKWHTGAGGERKVADRLRDRELIAKGWKVRRFWVDELAADMEGCLDIVERDLGLKA